MDGGPPVCLADRPLILAGRTKYRPSLRPPPSLAHRDLIRVRGGGGMGILFAYNKSRESNQFIILSMTSQADPETYRCDGPSSWLNPNNITLSNSCRNVACLHRDGIVIKKPVVIHSRDRVSMRNDTKRKGRHTDKSPDQLGLSWIRL